MWRADGAELRGGRRGGWGRLGTPAGGAGALRSPSWGRAGAWNAEEGAQQGGKRACTGPRWGHLEAPRGAQRPPGARGAGSTHGTWCRKQARGQSEPQMRVPRAERAHLARTGQGVRWAAQGGNRGASGGHSEVWCARRRAPRRTKQHTSTMKSPPQQPEHKGGAEHGGQARQGHTAGTDGQRAHGIEARYNATRSTCGARGHTNNKTNTQEYAPTAQGAQDGREGKAGRWGSPEMAYGGAITGRSSGTAKRRFNARRGQEMRL